MASHRQHVINLIQSAASTVNYSGTFLCSSRNELSLYAPEKPEPYIHLFNDFRMERIILNDSVRRSALLITFLFQDTQETTPEQMQSIVDKAEQLCDDFLTHLREQQIEVAATEPLYKITSGVLTGVSLTITIVTDVEC